MSASPRIVVLSARTPAALARTAARLAQHLRDHPELRLDDVATTLALGREAFAQRCAVVAADLAATAAGLTAAGRAQPAVVVASPHPDAPALAALAELWCGGAAVDLVAGRPGRRIHLPGYAFARDGGWAERAAPAGPGQPARPLTARQQRLIFHDLVRSGSSSAEHNLAAAADVDPGVDPAALASAFAELQRAHPILRTVFRRIDERWMSVEEPGPLVALAVREGPGSGDPLAELAARPFVLVDSPLVRAELVPGGRSRVLVVVMHAAVADVVAPQALLAELGARAAPLAAAAP